MLIAHMKKILKKYAQYGGSTCRHYSFKQFWIESGYTISFVLWLIFEFLHVYMAIAKNHWLWTVSSTWQMFIILSLTVDFKNVDIAPYKEWWSVWRRNDNPFYNMKLSYGVFDQRHSNAMTLGVTLTNDCTKYDDDKKEGVKVYECLVWPWPSTTKYNA